MPRGNQISDAGNYPETEECPYCGYAWTLEMGERHSEECPNRHNAEIVKRFTYHKPSAEQIPKYNALRMEARQMARMIMRDCPDSWERSIAVRKLEECIMWANASIARGW